MSITLTQQNTQQKSGGIKLSTNAVSGGSTAPTLDQIKQFQSKKQGGDNNQQPQGFLGKIGSAVGHGLLGIGKGAVRLGVGGAKLIGGALGFKEPEKNILGGAPGSIESAVQPKGTAEKVGATVFDIASIFAQPELALDKLGLSGLTHLAEKGAISPETLQKISGAITSKYGRIALKSIQNFVQGFGYTGAQAASKPGVSSKDAISTAAGGGILNVIAQPLAELGLNKISEKLFPKVTDAITSKVPKEGKTIVGKLFGSDAEKLSIAKKDPIAKEFQAGTRTLSQTATKIKSGISSFVSKGKSELEKVFSKLPKNIDFKPQQIVSAVQNGMNKVISGVEKSSGAKIRSIEDMLTKTKFTPEEQKVVRNLVDRVKTWSNNTPRGIAELRRVLYNEFNRGDGSISDRVVSKVNDELKSLVAGSSKEYGPALKKSIDNIDKVESLTKSFLDKNGKIVESKVAAFARALKDPALKDETKKILQNVLGDSYDEVIKELEGFNNHEILQKIKTSGLVKKLETAGAIAGGGYVGLQAIKNIFSGKNQ